MIAVLVLLAAMGCLALSIYKVKEWYRKNTRTADPDACEQEKVNLKMMEQARQREQVIKPEPPPDGYTASAGPHSTRSYGRPQRRARHRSADSFRYTRGALRSRTRYSNR